MVSTSNRPEEQEWASLSQWIDGGAQKFQENQKFVQWRPEWQDLKIKKTRKMVCAINQKMTKAWKKWLKVTTGNIIAETAKNDQVSTLVEGSGKIGD